MNNPTTPELNRATFTINRALEFFSEKELTMQIGFGPEQWGLALLKELIDNGLDACENQRIAPVIRVAIENDQLVVHDNGPGLPSDIINRSLNYQIRVSDKAHYVSPTRGQLGNALKCLWAAPYILNNEQGQVIVEAHGVRHQIDVALDRIAQEPKIVPTRTASVVKTGTLFRFGWPDLACSVLRAEDDDFYNVRHLLQDYSAFNPHASFYLSGTGQSLGLSASQPAWEKWLPANATSPHWYTPERLTDLIAGYLKEARDGGRARSVREFVGEFVGLSGSQKQKTVTDAVGLSGLSLGDLVRNGDIDTEVVARLLAVMQQEARPLKPQALGVLGRDHLLAALAQLYQAEIDTIRYKRVAQVCDGLPFVLETAFGICTKEAEDRPSRVVCGLNWSPALQSPFYQLDHLLGEMRIDLIDPVVLLVHLACPRLEFTDKGKGHLGLAPSMKEALVSSVRSVAKDWKVAKRQADRRDRLREQHLEELRKGRRRGALSIKAAAYRVMAQAYQHASNNGRLPANARQIMYAARPLVLQLTNGKCWRESSYFTQNLLTKYLRDHPEATKEWDVVFDARGQLTEPHTEHRVSLGTIAVRNYIRDWKSHPEQQRESLNLRYRCSTKGPAQRYRFALFVEKEGFNPLLDNAHIADRFDLAIMSTKGMSVTACRQLVERLSDQGVTILVLRDFDKSGFSIVHTLRDDTERYTYQTKPKVIDLGLRLSDVQELNLDSEPVENGTSEASGQAKDPRIRLRECGATDAECAYLVREVTAHGWKGERVELNAMTSQQFLDFVEQKLAAHGVGKVVPDKKGLADAYRQAWILAEGQAAAAEVISRLQRQSVPVPKDLSRQVDAAVRGTAKAWDEVIWEIAQRRRQS